MIGIQELIIPIVIIGLIAIFGKKTIMKIIRDFFDIKKDVKAIEKSVEKDAEPESNKPKD